jgi:tRNA(His) 5'-end guanylyltransferase
MSKDQLGSRMKNNYENRNKTFLTRRTPVIIRIDGKAFHSFTKRMERPFDDILIKTMQETTKFLCENIEGCKFGYTQSDEISLLLTDYDKLTTEAWFDYSVQKICSVSTSMTTLAFNKFFINNNEGKYADKNMTAMFDSRCFNIPKEEVVNYFIWRQQDATRNSIQMAGQANFSHKELHCKSTNDIQEMLFQQKNINWNEYFVYKKRGSSVVKTLVDNRTKWFVDLENPIFSQERDYIEKYI